MTTPAPPLVLLVEDDHGVRRPLEKFLQMHRFKVVTAETADDAIDAIHQHRPVAAIVDLRLARGSGRDVVISMPAGTPVIIFSGVPIRIGRAGASAPADASCPETLLAHDARRSAERDDQQREASASLGLASRKS